MSSHSRPMPFAARRQTGRTRDRCRFLLIATALTIQGCVATPPRPLVGPDAADPRVRIPAVAYRSGLGDFHGARPREPEPWRQRNDGAEPQPKKNGQ